MTTTTKFKVAWSKPKKFEDGNFNQDFDGVYLIGYRDTRTNERYPVYVGQGDVGARLSDHYQNNACIKKRLGQANRVGYYRYAECADEDDRLDIELGIYHNHRAAKICNETEPPGSGRYDKIHVEEEFSGTR